MLIIAISVSMPRTKNSGRKPQRTPSGTRGKEPRFVSEESTPERKKLNKPILDEYLANIIRKRTDRAPTGKGFQTWRPQEVGIYYQGR